MNSRRWRGARGGVVEQDPVVWRVGVGGDADSRQHLWGQGPFRFGGGRRSHKERIEAVHASGFYPASGRTDA